MWRMHSRVPSRLHDQANARIRAKGLLSQIPNSAGPNVTNLRATSTGSTKRHRTGAPGKHWTTHLGQAAAHPAAFAIVILYALLWLVFDRRTFDFNAVATLGVWLMTLFIQRSTRRDTLALHAKLDELLRTDENARSELARLDEQEPEAISRHRDAEVQALRTSR
jgi:low affinity Fe/Cu permease